MDYEKKYKEALERAKRFMSIRDVSPEEDPFIVAKELCEEIFPELAESEDEWIRKEIIKFIQDFCNPCDPDCDKWIAYLEKQKETITSKTKDYTIANDYTSAYYEERGYKNGYADGVRDTKAAIAKSPVEQKPAEWSEEKEKAVDNYADEIIKWEDAHKDWDRQVIRATAYHFFNLQPKQEWTEEDEDIRQSIIKDIKWERDNTPVTVDKDIRKYDEQINWLKSLRPQPKVEWDEEDENCFRNLCDIINSDSRWNEASKQGFIKWLKSLLMKCPKKLDNWKPSEDLEAEIERVLEDLSFRATINSGGFTTTVLDYPKIARHFYELGKGSQPQLPSDTSMTQEKFNESIEAWKARYNHPDNIPIKAAIAFTMRMCTSYPELAKNYYDSLPKVTQD